MAKIVLKEGQKKAILAMVNKQRCLLRARPGWGKTITVLAVLKVLRDKGICRRALIVAKPKELDAWESRQNNPYGLTKTVIRTNAQFDTFILKEFGLSDMLLVSSSLLVNHAQKFIDIVRSADFLSFDEAHSYRVYDSKLTTVVRRAVENFNGRCYPVTACVTDRVLSLTDSGFKTGDMIKVGDLVDTPLGFRKVTEIFKNDPVRTFRVWFKNGFFIEGSYNHPLMLYATGEWKQLKDLEVGDLIVRQLGKSEEPDRELISYKLPVKQERYRRLYHGALAPISVAKKNKLDSIIVDEDFAAFSGWLTGDGYLMRNEGRIGLLFAPGDQKIKEKVLMWLKNIGLPLHWQIKNPGDVEDLRGVGRTEPMEEVRFSCWSLRQFIIENGYDLEGAVKSSVPKYILEARRSVRMSYLKYLFAADGYFSNDSIRLTSVSLVLVRQVQLMLQSEGVISGIHKRKDDVENVIKTRGCYDLIISSSQKMKFVNSVGIPENKVIDLTDAVSARSLGELVYQSSEEITNIEELAEQVTYGITVDGGEYFTNGILSHNTPYYTELENAYSLFAVFAPWVFPSWQWFDNEFIIREKRMIYTKARVTNAVGSFKTKNLQEFNERIGYKNLDKFQEMTAPYVFYTDESDFTINTSILTWNLKQENISQYNNILLGVGQDATYSITVTTESGRMLSIKKDRTDDMWGPNRKPLKVSELKVGSLVIVNNENAMVSDIKKRAADADPLKCLIDVQQWMSALSEKQQALVDYLKDGKGTLIYFAYYESLEAMREVLARAYPGRQIVSITGKDSKVQDKLLSIRWDTALVLVTPVATQSVNMYCQRAIVYEPAGFMSGRAEQFIGRITRQDAKFREVDLVFMLGVGTSEEYVYSRMRFMTEQTPGASLQGKLPEIPRFVGKMDLSKADFQQLKNLLLWQTL